MFEILMGIPEMKALWDDLTTRKQQGILSGDEQQLFKKWGKRSSFCQLILVTGGYKPMKSSL